MPIARFQMPDGRIAKFEVPDGTTPEQAQAMIEEQLGASAAPAAEQPKWADLPGNIGPSAMRMAKGVYDAVSSPVQTASSILDIGAGALRNVTPGPLRALIDRADPNPQAAQRASNTAGAVAQSYKDRYGGLEQLKNTVITDPVVAAADASALLGVGGALVPGKAGAALQTASAYTNPLNAVKPGATAGGFAAKELLGLTTGQGGEAIAEAAKAGYAGKRAFWDNMTGKANLTDVIDDAKAALSKMKADKNAQYRSGMIAIKGDRAVLDFNGIDAALAKAKGSNLFEGQIKNPRVAASLEDVERAVTKWRIGAPDKFRTPEALDALKQRIGAELESIPFNESSARRAVGEVYNAVKDEITKQAPTYAKVMKGYAEAADEITQIEKALSLGGKASADTTLRKLQSLMRNNVQTTYGQRLKLAETLSEKGGADLMPALAGQSMNSWASRGLARLGQAGGGALGAYGAATGAVSPLALAAVPLGSPKLVGGGAFLGGRAAAGVGGLLDMAGGDTALRGLLAQRLLEAEQEKDW